MENDGIFTESKLKVVIICIDFVDSTATLISQGGSLLSIDNSIKFHKAIVQLIRNVYYPFIYLHEVIGDSFIIALNADWAYTNEIFCASLAINFIFDLVKNTRHLLKLELVYHMGHYIMEQLVLHFVFLENRLIWHLVLKINVWLMK